jgi:hypothetical protein
MDGARSKARQETTMAEHPRREPKRPEQREDEHPQGDGSHSGQAPGADAVRSRSADPGQSSYGGFRNEGAQDERKGHQPGAGPKAGTSGPAGGTSADAERPADKPTDRK